MASGRGSCEIERSEEGVRPSRPQKIVGVSPRSNRPAPATATKGSIVQTREERRLIARRLRLRRNSQSGEKSRKPNRLKPKLLRAIAKRATSVVAIREVTRATHVR